jgi:hypothetical protein
MVRLSPSFCLTSDYSKDNKKAEKDNKFNTGSPYFFGPFHGPPNKSGFVVNLPQIQWWFACFGLN